MQAAKVGELAARVYLEVIKKLHSFCGCGPRGGLAAIAAAARYALCHEVRAIVEEDESVERLPRNRRCTRTRCSCDDDALALEIEEDGRDVRVHGQWRAAHVDYLVDGVVFATQWRVHVSVDPKGPASVV